MSAVTRVLGLPELLENIMLQLAADAIVTSQYGQYSFQIDSPVRVLQPITALLPLYSVDRNFNAVMTGSHKLQRAIFAQRGSLKQRSRYSKYASLFVPLHPLTWLFEVKLDNAAMRLVTDAQGIKIQIDAGAAKMSFYRTKLKRSMASTFGAPAASWRRIQVFQSNVEEERLKPALVYYDGKYAARCGAYVESLGLEDGTTLGDIFESIMRISRRKQAQHVAAKTAYDSSVSGEV